MCFNAKGDWVPAAEPLHKDVDLRKQQKCGVGPALVREQHNFFYCTAASSPVGLYLYHLSLANDDIF